MGHIGSIGVVGLGKLGSCLAATLANSGYSVTGIDLNPEITEKINNGQAPFPEPNLQEYIDEAGDDFIATDDYESLYTTDATFIVVNTPSTTDGRYSLEYVESVCESLGKVIQSTNGHLISLTSTVFPGSTGGPVRKWLENHSGKKVGQGFDLVYSPEFIALGNVIEGLENPDFFLIGENSERGGNKIKEIYQEINSEPPVARMSLVDAEVTKMAVNSYVTMKISFANTLAEIAEGLDGNVDVISKSLALDSRINGKYLTAGARYGGPCFPRDNIAFSRVAEDAGTQSPLAKATDKVNDLHTEWISDAIRQCLDSEKCVAILGLSYKPNTNIMEESQGRAMISSLTEESELIAYDPMIDSSDLDALGNEVVLAKTLNEALNTADIAVITIPTDEFKSPSNYVENDLILIDPWRLFDIGDLPKEVEYKPLGRGRLVE